MNDEKTIQLIAKEISNLMPDCCGVTLGGSRSRNLDDENSDVEMYFYSHNGAPSLESLNECLTKLNAKHKRYPEFLWDNVDGPWGQNSYFVIDDLYFEIGYRKVNEIKSRINDYINGNVAPQPDSHDLGLGFVPGSLAASIVAEKPLMLCNDEFYELKTMANSFSSNLLESLKVEYFDTATSLINGKLISAVNRNDFFFYQVISNRIIRCLFIMAFAISKQHFPGDKWNEELLLQTNWIHAKKFIDLLKESINYINDLFKMRSFLVKAYNLILAEMENN